MNFQNLVDYCQWQNIDIFENCTVPAPLNMDYVKNEIMKRCGLLRPVYGEPEVFKQLCKMWFDSNQWNFEHLVKIVQATYSPIENVYESDHYQTKHTGTDKTVNGGKDINSATGSDSFIHGEKHTLSGSDGVTYGKTQTLSGQDTLQHGETHTLSGQDTLQHGEKHTLSGEDTFEHGEKHTLSGEDTFEHGEKHTLGGTDTVTDGSHTEHQVSAFNSSAYQPSTKDSNGGDVDTKYGKTDTASGTDTTGYGKTDTASGTDTTGYGKTDTASGTDTTGYGRTDTASGTDTTGYGRTDTASGTDTTGYGKKDTASGTDTTNYGKIDTASGTDTTNYGKRDTLQFGKTEDFTHGHIETYDRLRHGNVGITTNNQLINQELEMLEKFNPYDWIAAKFERENFLQIY